MLSHGSQLLYNYIYVLFDIFILHTTVFRHLNIKEVLNLTKAGMPSPSPNSATSVNYMQSVCVQD